MAKIKTIAVTMTNTKLLLAYQAVQKLGETHGKNRDSAQKLARVSLLLDAKVKLYEMTRNNMFRSNTVKDAEGKTLFHDEYGQNPRMRWEFQGALMDLDLEVVTLRCETLTMDEIGDNANSNMLVALSPLLAEPLLGEIESDE